MRDLKGINMERPATAFVSVSEATEILERTISFVQNCDNKASIVLGVYGIIFTIALTNDGISNLKEILKSALRLNTYSSILYVVMLILSIFITAFGVFRIIKVLEARISFSKGKGLVTDSKIFFGSISKDPYWKYRKKLLSMTEKDYLDNIITEIYINSCICSNKYQNYNCGLKYSIIGSIIFFALWIIGVVIY